MILIARGFLLNYVGAAFDLPEKINLKNYQAMIQMMLNLGLHFHRQQKQLCSEDHTTWDLQIHQLQWQHFHQLLQWQHYWPLKRQHQHYHPSPHLPLLHLPRLLTHLLDLHQSLDRHHGAETAVGALYPLLQRGLLPEILPFPPRHSSSQQE